VGPAKTLFLMTKCRAFFPIAGTRAAWLPCVRKAEDGSPFCRTHGDAIFGAVLGALANAEPLRKPRAMRKAKSQSETARKKVQEIAS
jgi:hypothetical protein